MNKKVLMRGDTNVRNQLWRKLTAHSVTWSTLTVAIMSGSAGCRSALLTHSSSHTNVAHQASSPALPRAGAAAGNRVAQLGPNQSASPEHAQTPVHPGDNGLVSPVVAANYQADSAYPAASAGVPGAVARTPMYMAGYMNGSPSPASGVPARMANYSRPGSAAGHGAGCPCGMHGTSAYQPLYPQFAECGVSPPVAYGQMYTNHVDPQEYIYDGGDRPPAARVRNDGVLIGITPEDTVIQYDVFNENVTRTADNQVQREYELSSGSYIEPACRVPIYAPRFGAIRKTTSTITNDRIVSTTSTLQPEGPGALHETLAANAARRREQLIGEHGVSLIEGFREKRASILVDDVLPTLAMSGAWKPFEDLQIMKDGNLQATDKFKLERSAAAARVWGVVESVEVIIDDQAASVVSDAKGPAAVVLYELDGKPRVRICKVASHQIADPGDIIDFTLRFDNIGERVVGNIAIVDSLPPRLEYVDGSQQCSRPVRFTTTENEAGSQVLRWEIQEKVHPGDGGVVRFRCRVR